MCLTRRSNSGPKYATEDIVVYKILSPDLLSPYQEYQYELNKKVCSPLEFNITYGAIDKSSKKLKYNEHFYERRWFNAFKVIITLPKINKASNYFYYWEIGKGLHAYTKIERAVDMGKKLSGGMYSLNVFKCVIPKHSWYYLGINDEIVSDQLIIIEKMEQLWRRNNIILSIQ